MPSVEQHPQHHHSSNNYPPRVSGMTHSQYNATAASTDKAGDNKPRKSLTIHIDTPHVGPNGMPLVYGSNPEGPGKVKGRVRFSSNYDCKGKDILITYEARAEASWSTLENKKMVHHHTREDFGHQTWTLPLKHTKEGGSTIVAGDYEKEFEVLLVPSPSGGRNPSSPSSSTRHQRNASSALYSLDASSNRSAVYSAGQAITGGGSGGDYSSTSAAALNAAASALPSSSYGIHARMRYTIHAVLQRPFPSSNVEASQEIWVLHTSLPAKSPSSSLSKKRHSSGKRAPSPLKPTLPIDTALRSSLDERVLLAPIVSESESGSGSSSMMGPLESGVYSPASSTASLSGGGNTNITSLTQDKLRVGEPKTAVSKDSGATIVPGVEPLSKQTTRSLSAVRNKSFPAPPSSNSPMPSSGLGGVLNSVNVFRYIPTSLPAVDTIKKKIGTSIDKAEQLLLFSSSKLTASSPGLSDASSEESGLQTVTPTTIGDYPSSSSEKGNARVATKNENQLDLSGKRDSRRHSMQAAASTPASPIPKTTEDSSIQRSASLPSTRGGDTKDKESVANSARRGSKDSGRDHSRSSSDSKRHKTKPTDIEYTGVWEVFQMPYCLSLPSETVYLGQKVPLRVRFGPFPWTKATTTSTLLTSMAGDAHQGGLPMTWMPKNRRRTMSSSTESSSSSGSDISASSSLGLYDAYNPPRFRVTKGTLKLVEHILLRKIDHIEVPQRSGATQRSAASSRHQHQVSTANTVTHGSGDDMVSGSGGRFSIRRLVHRSNLNDTNRSLRHRRSEYLEHLHDESSGGRGPSPAHKSNMYTQGSNLSGSSHHLAVPTTAPSSPTSSQFPSEATSSKGGFRLWPKSSSIQRGGASRHSMDYSELAANHGRNPSVDALQLHLQANQGSSSIGRSGSRGAAAILAAANSAKPTTKVISQVEARYKTEVMILPLDPFLTPSSISGASSLSSENEKNYHHYHRRIGSSDDTRLVEDGDGKLYWETTIWFTVPDPSKVSPYTQTTNIVKRHTLQLILGCALELPLSHHQDDVLDSDSDGLPLPLPTPLQHLTAQPGSVITKPFRLELDLYLTGPRAPTVLSS